MLKAKRNGFVVECGASDGETYSNSLFFEVERNWKGTKEQEQKKLNDYREFFKNVGGYSEGKVHRGDVYFQKLT